jgi:hypothetical protein
MWKRLASAMAPSQLHSAHPLVATSATTPLKAKTGELRTLTSHNPGKCGHPGMESKVDGLMYVDYCDKGGFLRE